MSHNLYLLLDDVQCLLYMSCIVAVSPTRRPPLSQRHRQVVVTSVQCAELQLLTNGRMCVRVQAVQRFVVTDLSNWYLDVAKDRLYVRGPSSSDRRACQTVLHALLQVPLCTYPAGNRWTKTSFP